MSSISLCIYTNDFYFFVHIFHGILNTSNINCAPLTKGWASLYWSNYALCKEVMTEGDGDICILYEYK